jgi:hypothetical protein
VELIPVALGSELPQDIPELGKVLEFRHGACVHAPADYSKA